eukprot:CAMPEP_0115008518 /NCGR_PEP_ID=MMETSP0216-20121206/21978_1 /TAXON_ID=223996 /ORGANISM="Protocruzia adherens, Strain Boccale" /LENGTH=168 /DNA_ID=CAMNT_0002375977 /DNA_START=31 /DNA_END=537 /DNA_ORIENTATION=+
MALPVSYHLGRILLASVFIAVGFQQVYRLETSQKEFLGQQQRYASFFSENNYHDEAKYWDYLKEHAETIALCLGIYKLFGGALLFLNIRFGALMLAIMSLPHTLFYFNPLLEDPVSEKTIIKALENIALCGALIVVYNFRYQNSKSRTERHGKKFYPPSSGKKKAKRD